MDERPREPFAMGMPSLAARARIACALQPIRPAIWPASIPERANCRKVWSSTSLQLICLPKLYLYVSGAISSCAVTTYGAKIRKIIPATRMSSEAIETRNNQVSQAMRRRTCPGQIRPLS